MSRQLDPSSAYDSFARLYDRHWGPVAARDFLPVLDQLLLGHLPSKARILDLCCGSGRLAAALTTRDYEVVGLDSSPEMIQIGRVNAPRARFLVADARSFELPDRFHAVISTFDSLNHILEPAELEAVFRRVCTGLLQDGWFLFDLNMEEGFRDRWGDSFGFVEHDHACIVRTGYLPDERLGTFDITVFAEDGGWQRADLALTQRCYSLAQVTTMLEHSGFGEVEVFDAEQDLAMAGHTGRSVFVCRRSEDVE